MIGGVKVEPVKYPTKGTGRLIFKDVMLSPCGNIAISPVSGIDKEVSLAIRTGYVGEGPFESGAVHAQVGRSNVGDGAGKGIGLENHRFSGFSVPVGSHKVNSVFGARVGRRFGGITSDGSGVCINGKSTGQSGCGPSRSVSADGNGVGGLNGKGYPGVEGDQGVRGYDHRSGFTADCGVQTADLAVGEGYVVEAEVLQATLEPIVVSVFTGSKVNVLFLFDPYGVVHRGGLNGRAIDVGLCDSRVALVGEGDHGPLFGRDPIGVVDPHIGVGAHSKAVMYVTAVGVVVVTKFEKVVSAASGEYCAPSAGTDFVTQPDVCGVLAIGRHAHDPMVGDADEDGHNTYMGWRLYRGTSTVLKTFAYDGSENTTILVSRGGQGAATTMSTTHLDSPATTSAVTYKTMVQRNSPSNRDLRINWTSTQSMTLMEIAQ